ncbi:hypothetical protein [Actinokineospora terrae]|uniref:Uncharacterized protein n=1 Tax=Actinokineospora terrae TaxID=155974 RepID=A0A1H9T488_9PSEU|nr:hypothetical protein [Actinokineospora terrae]SER91936.1 hypothetical protein SAMN04487818_10663 [Actinokineospora terrae]
MRLQLQAMWTVLHARWDQLRRRPEAGYSTEAVLVTALLVVAAIAVIAIIVDKVTEKATGITM